MSTQTTLSSITTFLSRFLYHFNIPIDAQYSQLYTYLCNQTQANYIKVMQDLGIQGDIFLVVAYVVVRK